MLRIDPILLRRLPPAAVLAFLAFAEPAAGLPQDGAIQPLTAAEERVLVVRERVPLTVRAYQPPYELRLPARPEAASYATPEAALEAWAGALTRRDRSWLDRSLDAARRATHGPQDERLFDLFLRDRRLVLGHRLEVRGRTLVELSSYDREGDEELLRILVALSKDTEGGWRVSQIPETPLFSMLSTRLDLLEDRLEVDLGLVLRTIRPR